MYYVRCPECDRVYATGQNIKLIELDAEQRAAALAGGSVYWMDCDVAGDARA